MAVPPKVASRAAKLRAEIEAHNHAYYVLDAPTISDAQFDQLTQVNRKLWTIEDAIRLCEKAGDFGKEFITLARSVYQQNDERE